MVKCIVNNCQNKTGNRDSESGVKFAFYRFPLVEEFRNLALKLCGKDSSTDFNKNWRICSDHYRPQDFDPAYSKPRLLPSAIPSLNLRDTRPVRMFPSYSNFEALNDRIVLLESKIIRQKARLIKLRDLKSQAVKNKISHENSWRVKFQLAKMEWKRKEKTYLSTITNMKNEKKGINIRERLRPILTPLQQRVLLNNKTRTHWTTTEISKAITLKAISRKAYEYVREVWHVPLPCVSTLQRLHTWCSKIEFNPGILRMPLKLLEKEYSRSDFKRQCTLAYDEMSVDSKVAYFHKTDQIIGPHTKMHLTTLRGISCAWKQPVHLDFDFKYTFSSLINMIITIQRCGLNVKATVSDLDPDNQGLITELGIGIDKPYFLNPVTNERVWVFADYPHMIKLIRNNLLDSGLKLGDKTIVSKADFQELIDTDMSEIKICFKLTQKHLDVVGQERMRVTPVFQVFSATVAAAFRKYFPQKKRIAEFVQLVNDASDILNARVPIDTKNDLKSGYGSFFERQKKILDEFAEEIRNMRIGRNGRKLYPFQKGILISIGSLKGIYNELRVQFKLKYILPYRFNQDHLEDIFSIVRGLGQFYTHPCPVDCINRLKIYMLSMSLKSSSSGNTKFEHDENFQSNILSTLMKRDRCIDDEATEAEQLSAHWDETSEFFEEVETPVITQENFDSHVNSLTSSEQFEFGGQEYLAGFIASKILKKYTNEHGVLTIPSANLPMTSWLKSCSRGGLTSPSCDWLTFFRHLNDIFVDYHKDAATIDQWEIYRGLGVMSRLAMLIHNMYPEVNKDLVNFFVKTRTFIRIKHVNRLIKEEKRGKSRFF